MDAIGVLKVLQDGRSVIVDASDRKDMFDRSWDARSQLHEYGGAASTAFGGVLYFSHIVDHRVYKTTKGAIPEPITPGWCLAFSIHSNLTLGS